MLVVLDDYMELVSAREVAFPPSMHCPEIRTPYIMIFVLS